MTGPRALHVLPAPQHEPGAGSGSVSRQCPSSQWPCQGDNLGHICPGKGFKGSSWVWLPSRKMSIIYGQQFPPAESALERFSPSRNPGEMGHLPRTQTPGLKGVVLAGSFLLHHLSSCFLNVSEQAFPASLHIHRFQYSSTTHMGQQQPGCCISRVQRAK